MRWSLEELKDAWDLYRGFRNFPRNSWQRLKLVLFWIRFGYTKQFQWDLYANIGKEFVFRVKKFRDSDRYGIPMDVADEAEWTSILDEMIDTWDKMNKEFYLGQIPLPELENADEEGVDDFLNKIRNYSLTEEQLKTMKNLVEEQRLNNARAFELFNKYFQNLWD